MSNMVVGKRLGQNMVHGIWESTLNAILKQKKMGDTNIGNLKLNLDWETKASHLCKNAHGNPDL